MATIGNSLAPYFTATTSDVFSANGTGTTFTLTRSISNLVDIEVLVNNIQQNPFNGAYSVNGTTLTFSEAPSAGANNVLVSYRQAVIGSSIPTPNTVASISLQRDLTLGGNTTSNGTMFTQALVPTANVTYDIGTSTLRYKDIYLSGTTIKLGDVSLSASGNTFTVANSTGGTLPSSMGNTTIAGTANVTGDMTIGGNLTVTGTMTYINTTDLNIGDAIISLNADLAANIAPTEDAGININRGASTNAQFKWIESTDNWSLGNTTVSGILTSNDHVITGTANVSTGINVGANVSANTTALRVGNSTVNTTISATALTTTSNTVSIGTAAYVTSAGKTGFATSAPAATVHVAGNTILSNVNVLGASYDSVSFSVAGEDLTPSDLFFSPDGLKMYILGSTGDDVNEYNLSTAWVVSSAVFVTNFSVASQDSGPSGLFFRADGTKMYVVGGVNDIVFQYTLSTPWSVATASYDSISFSVTSQDTTPSGMWFKPNGLSMYIVGSIGDAVYQYTLSTAWNVSTATFLQSFSVSSQESAPNAVTFTGDGSRMFVMGQTGDDVNVYNLTTPWDISTAAFVNVFSVSGQEPTPQGIYIKPDGTKMYMVGSTNDTVYQYTVPSIDIQLTGPTSVAALDVQQDLTVYGNTKVYKISSSVGSATSPAITTTGDTNTGIFFPAADTIAFTEGGVEAMRIDSNGNLGVGTSSPLEKFMVSGPGVFTGQLQDLRASSIVIDVQSGIGGRIISTGPNASTHAPIAFATTTTTTYAERMRIDTDGNVGIGTTTPSTGKFSDAAYAFLIQSASTTNGTNLFASNSDNSKFVGFWSGHSSAEPAVGVKTGNALTFGKWGTINGTGGFTENMRIDSSGRLLLGVTSGTGMSAGDFAMANGKAIRFRNAADSAFISALEFNTSNGLDIGKNGSLSTITFGISGIGEVSRFDTNGQLSFNNIAHGTAQISNASYSLNVASGGTVDFSNFSGMIIVNNWNQGSVAVWIVGGGTYTLIAGISLYYGSIGYTGAYRWTSNSPSTHTYTFTAIRTRPNA